MTSILRKVAATTPSAGTVAWFKDRVDNSASQVLVERVLVTPGLAGEILRRNPDNRNMRQIKIEHFVRDMVNGRWADNGEPIIISRDGLLNDGQHRLQAVIEANTPQVFVVVFGVSRESRTTVDQGTARGAADYLSMDGVTYAHNAATAAKFIIAYERSDGRNLGERSKLTNAEVVARVKADPCIVEAAAYAHKHLKQYRRLFSHTVMAASYYVLSQIDRDDATAFLDAVATGESIKNGDPAYAVRTAFLRDKYERQPSMEIIFHGWNKFRTDSKAKLITPRGSFPALV
jgi:hypothetical protein